jgi:hypothetical protein
MVKTLDNLGVADGMAFDYCVLHCAGIESRILKCSDFLGRMALRDEVA